MIENLEMTNDCIKDNTEEIMTILNQRCEVQTEIIRS